MDHLWIQFEHLLKHDKELAYAICNSQHSFNEWVYPTVSHYLTGGKNMENIGETMVSGEVAMFYKMPHSIKPLADLLRENSPVTSIKLLFDGSKLCVASAPSLSWFHGFLVEIFKHHMDDKSWNGRFNISDMVVIDFTECRITKKPESGGSDHRIKDFGRVQEIFMPYFTSEVGMPLFFGVLQQDLRNASKDDVEDESFREYLLSHVAFKSPMARLHFLCRLQKAVENFGTHIPNISSALGASSEIQDWKKPIPNVVTDVLYKVYWHKFVPSEQALEPFDDTAGDLLRYMRNFLQHGHKHVEIQNFTELEQFLSKKFCKALPYILRRLLRDCKMHMNTQLTDLWKAYRDSNIGDGGDTHGRIGHSVSFW